jgi:basic membrane lipoprotein Med (substrate-binding protein (PBP1-ABC) superfamily)
MLASARRRPSGRRRGRRGGFLSSSWHRWRHASLWWRAGSLAGLLAVIVAVLVVTLSGGKPTVDGGRYLAFTSCLITGSPGISASPASAAWAGIEDAAQATRMQAHYLVVPARTSSGGATPYLNGLLAQRCDLVVAVGTGPAAAVRADAHSFAGVRFVVVGGTAAGQNVTVVHAHAGSVRSAVDSLATAALRASR